MRTIRAFIALHLPDEVRSELDRVSRELADQMPPRVVRWVKPDRIHLTLRFLGETNLSKLPALARAIDDLAAHHNPFELRLDDLGCFPNLKRPRVIWAGIQGDIVELGSLKKALDGVLDPLGWAVEDRPFRAHLTLGRVRDSRKLAGVDWQAEVQNVAIPITLIHLIESQLTPTGPIYTSRHTGRLQSS